MLKNPAIILGCDSNGYGIIRSLNLFDKTIQIIAVDYNVKAPALYSKHVSKRVILPNPEIESEEFVNGLIKLGQNFKKTPVLFITSDLFLNVVNKNRKILEDCFLFNIPDKDTLETIIDKKKQYKVVSEIYSGVPKTYEILSEEYLKVYKIDLNFPVFIKGSKSFEWKKYFIEKGFIANSYDELNKIIKKISDYNLDLIIQELVTGPNSNHYKVSAYYNKEGNLKLLFTTRKMRQFPVDFGVGSYMISERIDELKKIGRLILDKLNYKGVGSIEFKLDDRVNEFKYIELNPRFWQQNYQATVAGMNFAEYYYLDCVGEDLHFNDQFFEGITYMDTINDFQSFQYNRKYTGETYFKWLKQLIKCNSYALFSINDIQPIIISSKYGLNFLKYLYKFIVRMIKN